ncbi:hypothetical protein [Maribacter hydrothermalis]|uniref:Uncharacterized protein n=1 Tax=Maribacter hydrothermalis TaxID=1836467 RepID=A0A1B7Z371_9FLAO|nr:hypothetical protein [Maribacter hydrothermalis]APQ16919.1 hypothetical protein BTR34_06110 [Maribacter hydrothermalis]OBR37181.1 hypothetical protein A9200_05870 [Maribacter hydrothermalis]
MDKPITLYVPEYYDKKVITENRLILIKTKALLAEDNNKSQFIASIEKTKDYNCAIPEISDEHRKRATKSFHKDRAENWELRTKISGYKVYTNNWDDKEYHYRIYWIVISEEYLVQLLGFFEPKFSDFYKQHFMINALDTKIDAKFDFTSVNNINELFECIYVKINADELQERINIAKQKEIKARYLEENLTVSNTNFYSILAVELDEKEEALINNFICSDWNMYYDLYNPENFSNPDSTLEWENNSDVYEYYEQPHTDNSKVNIVRNEKICGLDSLKNLVNNTEVAEQKLLSFFEYYTFGNGGAYADAVHFKYAKLEIERLHNTSYTNKEFLKRNLCLQDIIITANIDELKLYFKCSWDTEHGIEIIINSKYECKAEE